MKRRPSPMGRPDAPGAQPSPPGGFGFGTYFGGPAATDAFGARRAPSPFQLVEKYGQLIYAMVCRNANSVSRIPLRLYADGSRVQGRPRRDCDAAPVSRHIGLRLVRAGMASPAAVDQIYEIRNHGLLDVLDDPDGMGYFDRKSLIALMVAYMDVVGGGMVVPEGRGWDWKNPDIAGTRRKGPPERLWVVYSQHLVPYREAGSPLIAYWWYFRDRLPFGETLWFRHGMSLRDAYGSTFSPTYAGDSYADQELRFGSIWDQVLALGPRPNVVASPRDPDMPLGEESRRRLQQDFLRSHSAGRAGGLWVASVPMDFNPISYAPADLGAKEINEYNLYRLASIFGQPPTYYTVDSNLANLQAADEQYARLGIEPRCDAIASKLTRMARAMDPRLFFKFDPALPEDDEARQRVIDMQLKTGQITINQANEELKFPPVPYGDEPILPDNMLPLSAILEKHQQGMQQQQAAIESQRRKDDFELSTDPAEPDMEQEQGQEQEQQDQDQERAVRDLVARHRWRMDEVNRRLAS